MRFFNLDLHIGVIGDIKQIFNALGHEVTQWSLSAHSWVLDRRIDKVDVVNQHTWRDINPEMCKAFYDRYKSELEQYDAFIVTHTPCFAMLYERWNKPIICVASTRYEAPFTDSAEAWAHFNSFLRNQIDSGMLIPLANNKYDSAYAEYFTQRQWKVIPSLCNYTSAPYTGELRQSLYVSKFELPRTIPNLVSKGDYFKRRILQRVAVKLGIATRKRGYSWRDIAAFRSAVVVPYNASIMSIFEMYASGIPMLFPSLKYAVELYGESRRKGIFSELSYNQVRGLPSGSVLPCDSMDPNNYDDVATMEYWIEKSDFYDSENMKHLTYFDSFDEIDSLLRTVDFEEVHRNMIEHHRVRSANAYAAWKTVLNALSCRHSKGQPSRQVAASVEEASTDHGLVDLSIGML